MIIFTSPKIGEFLDSRLIIPTSLGGMLKVELSYAENPSIIFLNVAYHHLQPSIKEPYTPN